MSVIFNNESRSDLAQAIRTDYTCQYVFPKVFPAINVYEESGVFSAADLISATASTSRNYNADLTLNHYGNQAISYTTALIETRIACTDADLKNKGDNLDEIQAEMANAGADATLGSMEIAAQAALAAGAGESLTLDETSPLATIAEAAYKVAPFGNPTLVCSQAFLASLLKNENFVAPILKLFGQDVITGLISGADAVLQSVGGWAGLPGGILVGKDAYWAVSDDDSSAVETAFVVGIRPEMQDPSRAYWTAKAKPTLGATLTFLPRDREGTPWYVDTVYLPGPRLNCVDTGIKAVSKVFNGEAVVALTFAAD